MNKLTRSNVFFYRVAVQRFSLLWQYLSFAVLLVVVVVVSVVIVVVVVFVVIVVLV